MPDRKLNFGVVGCGRISRKHLEALVGDAFPGKLVAVTDIVEEKARAKAEQCEVPYYLDYHEMMRRHPEIDVIDVLTPTGYHAEHVTELARYGKHIVVEKPMALRVPDCRTMMRACRRRNCRLFVVKQNRFNPAVVAARAALESGRFGRLVMGTVRVRWRRDQGYYEADDWHGTWELDGGVMSQQASHHLDLLQWFMGPVESVQCRTATRLLDIEVEDTAAATLSFESGALGVFEATVATRPETLEGSLSILGERGSVIIGGPAVNKVLYWGFEEPRPEDEQARQNFSQEVPDVYGHGHGAYLAHVVDAIVNDKPGLVEGPEGEKNVRILTALYESAARGGRKVRPGCRILHSKLGRRE
ncbi:MAG: oxidoreductase [Planctomycetes bacterium SM23_65]|nr:MAG: oxidoreductase [Planctomycetes bacterium SM23_65]